jgi:uncharacterized protein YbbC (DUF1343 family)
METGLDRLLRLRKNLIQGKSVGVLGHPASVDKLYRPILRTLSEETDCRVVALFGPEHGFLGQAQDMEAVEPMQQAAIPVYSLYGKNLESLRPKKEWLKDCEVLIIDLQDIGSRYYTFIYTMAFCMEVAGQTGTKVLVLDRPNPINGHQVEGNLVENKFRSFVGYFPLTNRHGMTIGELAQMFREEFSAPCDLEVIPMKGWHRRRYFDELDLPWVLPSPNMPTVDTAVVYPGMCLLEGTELSEGRGTTRPFEIFGAPYVDPEKLVKRLREFHLPGVRFRPLFFKPLFQKHAGTICGGAQIHVTRRRAYKSLLTGVAVLKAVRGLYPEQFRYREQAYEFVEDIPAIDLLAGNDQLRMQLEKGMALKEIENSWEEDKVRFLELRKKYRLYT